MNIMQRSKIQSVFLSVTVMALVLASCDRADQSAASVENEASVGQVAVDQQPLGQVIEFDGYTLRANVSRTDVLPEAMAQKYGIEPEPNLFLLNVVVLENQAERRQPVPVSASVSAKHENLIGHSKVIDMRAVEANGLVSYIGTLDASAERFFRLVIEAQPEGSDQPLQMNFEVRLEEFEVNDLE